MLGIFVQLIISWLILRLFEKKDLKVLGFRPTKLRVTGFFLFFIITAICCSSGFFMRMYFGERWVLNPAFTGKLFFSGLWWHIKSVLYEELIFRGAILYILIKRSGVARAILISAVAFGIYHWFSFGIIGNVKQMAIIFIVTGLMGFVLAYGYTKTFSLYIPIAIHLGWNFTQGFIFPQGAIGNGILVYVPPAKMVTVSYFIYFFVIFFPMAAVILINYFLLRRRRQALPDGETKLLK
jgi:membrane protease YdiL (CAAX protease family)